MPTLPVLSGREVVQVFSRKGWEKVRQRGSHMILVKEGTNITLSVPDTKSIGVNLRRKIRFHYRGTETQSFFSSCFPAFLRDYCIFLKLTPMRLVEL